jgi:hypothetical protein
MMNKSLRARRRKSSRKRIYGFQHPPARRDGPYAVAQALADIAQAN